MKLHLLAALVSSFSFGATGYPVYGNLKQHVYKLYGGTGFTVKHRGRVFMITNWHVCKHYNPSTEAYNELTSRKSISTIIADFPSTDLCVLSTTEKDGLELGEDPKIGDAVYTGGYPSSKKRLNLSSGSVVRRFTEHLIMSSKAQLCESPFKVEEGYDTRGETVRACFGRFDIFESTVYSWYGASGSPILNSKGKVVGILHSTYNTGGSSDDGKAGSIPVSYLRKILDSFQSENP